MKNHQKLIRMDAYKILQNLMLTKSMSEGVKRAVRVRLMLLLDNEEQTFKHWEEVVKPKLNTTRQKQIEREFKKRIQAARIVIHWLTPFFERTTDVPTFVVRKNKE